jgi:hypothetical protein
VTGLEDEGQGARGFTGFLRGLLSGIPWSEKATREETVTVDAPQGGGLRIHNSNGRTRITGEDRRDIEVTAYKTARAGSTEAAEELLDEIALAFHESGEGLDLEVEIPRRRHSRGAANLCIKLPREMRVSVTAANGRVDVGGIRGAVEVRSSNGAASICEVVGDVQVATSNAKVHCSCNRGRLPSLVEWRSRSNRTAARWTRPLRTASSGSSSSRSARKACSSPPATAASSSTCRRP